MGRVVTEIQAFLVPDRRIVPEAITAQGAGTTGSSFTEAGPRPGTAVADDTRSGLTPRVHSAQDVDLDLYVIRGGDPDLDGCGILYRERGEADTSYRGWNEPNFVSAYIPVEWTTTEDWTVADAVTLPSSGNVVLVASDASATQPVSSWLYSPADRAWSTRNEIDPSNDASKICVVVTPGTERLIAFVIRPGGGTRPFESFYSDGGEEWELFNRNIFKGSTPDATVDEVTAEFDRYGNVALICTDSASGDWWLFRSTDGGTFFTLATNGLALGDRPTLRRMAGGALLFTYRAQADSTAQSMVLEDAYDTPAGKTPVAIDGVNEVAQLRSTVDDDGMLYAVLGVNTTVSADRWTVARSLDEGESWEVYGYGALQANSNMYRYLIKALATSGGELVAVANPSFPLTSPSTDNSLVAVHLGGWSNLEAVATSASLGARTGRWGFGYDGASATDTQCRLPGELLANQGWTHAGTAATLLNGLHRYSPVAATSSDLITFANAGTSATLIVEIQVASGGSLTASHAAIAHRRANGVYDRQVIVRATTTGFRVFDSHGAVAVGADVVTDMSSDVVQIAFVWGTTSALTILYKTRSASVWNVGPQGLITDGGGPAANDQVALGAFTAATVDVRFGMVAWMDSELHFDTADGGFGLERLEFGKSLTSAPYPVRDQGDSTRMCRISLAGGRGRYSETFDVDVVHDYGIERAFPQISPSPRSGWRSTQTASSEHVVFDFVGAKGLDTRLEHGWTLALGFFGPYVPRKFTISRKTNAAGAFTTLGTYDGATGFTDLNYQLDGDILRCNTGSPGTPGARMCWEGEWAGGYVIIAPGVTNKVRRIAWSTSGRWTATGGPILELRLLDMDGTEVTTGVVHLVHPGGVVIIPQAAGSVFRYLKVQVLNEPQPSAYFNVPAMVVGSCLVPGKQFGNGWSMRHVPRIRASEDEYGTTWAEKRGPVRRELTWSNQDGVDLYGARNSTTPNYLQLEASLPVEAAHGDVESRMAGMLATSRGGALPVVALLRMPQVATVTTITDPSIILYGRLTGTLQANQVVGKPGVGEYKRIESMSIVELPWDTE